MLDLRSDPAIFQSMNAIDKNQGNWYPASGGTETVFTTRTGRRLLYCWQPSTGKHAYLDVSVDLILSDQEAMEALALF